MTSRTIAKERGGCEQGGWLGKRGVDVQSRSAPMILQAVSPPQPINPACLDLH